MYKKYTKLLICLLAFISILTIFPSIKSHASNKKDEILLIYDTYKPYASDDNTLMYLNKIILPLGNNVDIANIKDVNDELLRKYNSLVVLCNEEEDLNREFKNSINSFNGKIVWVGENYNQIKEKKNKKHIEIKNLNSKTQDDIYKYFYDDGALENKKYLLIDDVNPFIDLNELVNKIDYLNSRGIQFILSTIPVFENNDFNAMKRFTEVLRYAQSKGGYIFLKSPYIMEKDIDENKLSQEIIKKSEIGYKSYINYLVYPLGLDIPNYFIYMDSMREFLNKADTVVLDGTDKDIINFGFYKNINFKNVLYKVNYTDINDIKNKYLNNIVVSVDNSINLKNFKEIINKLNDNEVYFNDPIYIKTINNLCDNNLISSTQGIFLNGKLVTQNRYISNEMLENKSNENVQLKKENTVSIEKPRNIVIIVSVIAIIIFGIIVILSRKIDRKKYFK